MQETYVVTEDTPSMFGRIYQNGKLPDSFLSACDSYFAAIAQTLKSGITDTVDVVGYRESEINGRLSAAVRQNLETDPNTYCICLDRYLISEIEKEFPGRFFRFSITRTTDGNKKPRAGDPSFTEQLRTLKNTIPDVGSKQAILIDDGIFSGGTIRDIRKIFQSSDVPLCIKSVLGFIGSADKRSGIKILEPTEVLYEWIDIRDFSPLAGKTVRAGRNNRVATAIPYLYPWSLGENATLDSEPKLFEISKTMIRDFLNLVVSFEAGYGKPLRFRELLKAGFTLPVSRFRRDIPVSINDRVTDYLSRCLQIIDEEQNRRVCIFDMDGTLYTLDGTRGGYSGSNLEKAVYENALAFIRRKEGCSLDEAQNIYSIGIDDPIGLSRYLSVKYGISRSDYFDSVWNINPTPIVKQYEIPVRTIRGLQKTDTKLILVTSAHGVWADNVLNALGLRNSFELVYTGDQFSTKDEIFKRLAGWYQPENVVSIGDQEKTDIAPAKAYGFRTLLVTLPNEIEKILSII